MLATGEVLIGTTADGEPFYIPEQALREHTLVFGSSGQGKSMFSCILAREQLKRGASLVVLDPQFETVHLMRGACDDAKISPKNVRVIDSQEMDSLPGYNPFLVPGPADAVAASFLDSFERVDPYTGSRMRMYLEQTVQIAVCHPLTLIQFPRFLYDTPFRESILSQEPTRKPGMMYRLARAFFTDRFSTFGVGPKDESVHAIEGALNKIQGNPVLTRLFNAPRNTLDFAKLFSEQGAILINFGAEFGVTESSGLLMASILLKALMSASATPQKRRPVVLMVDEIRKLSGFMERILQDVSSMSRKRHIRLIMSGQHPEQIPEGVRKDVMVSSSVKAYFYPGDEESQAAARNLARTSPVPGEGADERREHPDLKTYRGAVTAEYYRNNYNYGLQALGHWHTPAQAVVPVNPDDPEASEGEFLESCRFFEPPLYYNGTSLVRDAARRLPPGCVKLYWENGCGHVDIQVPTALRPGAKKPNNTSVEYWNQRLSALDRRQAIVKVLGREPTEIMVAEAHARKDASRRYIQQCRHAQSLFKPGEFDAHIDHLYRPPAPPAGKPMEGAVKPEPFVPEPFVPEPSDHRGWRPTPEQIGGELNDSSTRPLLFPVRILESPKMPQAPVVAVPALIQSPSLPIQPPPLPIQPPPLPNARPRVIQDEEDDSF